jgi:hypothetical protein
MQEFLTAAENKENFIMAIPSCFSCEHKKCLKATPVGSTVSGTQMFAKTAIKQMPSSTNGKDSGKRVNNKKCKRKAKANDKYHSKPREQRHSLDGLLYFPQVKVLLRPDFQHFDTLSIASSQGPFQHMVITPLNAFYLEENGFYPGGNQDFVELLHEDVVVSYKDPANESITRTRNIEIIVVDSQKAVRSSGTISPKKPGLDWIEGDEIQSAVEYLSETHIESSKGRGVDVIAIFATPIGKNDYMHALTMRWLAKPFSGARRNDADAEEIHQFLISLLSTAKGKMETGRLGGSNGFAHLSKEFLKMLHLPGITPRKSHAVVWLPVKTKWVYLYISPYHQVRKLCCRAYSQPLPGGQVRLSAEMFHSPSFPKFLRTIMKDFLLVKAESAPLVHSLNTSIFPKMCGFRACVHANIVQNVTNCIARICAKRKNDPEEFYYHLLTTCTFTVISYATRLHVDTPKKHCLLKMKSFWENKLLMEVPSRGTHDVKGLALGRGGAGRGKFVLAVLDHSYDPTEESHGWDDESEHGNGELFRELYHAAQRYGLDGPYSLESRAVMPHLIEAAIDNGIDTQLLVPP